MDNKDLAKKLFPNVKLTIEDIEKKYPPRDLAAGVPVTRVAPSPTGFMHIGGIFAALISERFSHQQNGIFYLRVEDTDKKREVEGAVELIIEAFKRYGLKINEGEIEIEKEIGAYGPYRQSHRAEIYQTVVKYLFEQGLAYPCFCSPEQLEQIGQQQAEEKVRPGYYGQWAKCRENSNGKIAELIDQGAPFTIRFKSNGNFLNKITVNDLIKGKKILPENDLDIILLKSDGLPTYHFAHVVDDHFMRTTHVLRGDEWFSSLPLHLQIFAALNFQAPLFGHISPIQKIENNSRRKLSKRKDPEANVDYYQQDGYPEKAIIEYLLNLANSDFEDWRVENPEADNRQFVLRLEKINQSGALFDLVKLQDISKNMIAKMSAREATQAILLWVKKYDPSFAKIISSDKEYLERIFNIERGGDHQRKDIAKWSDVKNEFGCFYDEIFDNSSELLKQSLAGIDLILAQDFIKAFLEKYNH
ncbi:MAG: glutamate--tRNA ligase, partial [Candidatus Gribaldobacteria bacterium]|nr:glutamate--tRNA ligase [Candidatus Gribaldobacteria bacterium]